MPIFPLVSALHILKALADESRLRLINILSRGPFSVQELTSILGVGQSTVSHHLKVLQSAGIASSAREGTWAFYSMAQSLNGHQKILSACIESLQSEADPELQARLENDSAAIKEIIDQRRSAAHKYFESIAPEWKSMSKGGAESSLNELAKRIPADAPLLELGCGSGALLEKILPRKGQTIAVDYSPRMLEEAKKNLGELAESADLRLGYLEQMPVKDSSVSCAAAHMVLHHLSHPEEALKEMARALVPGGAALIVDLAAHSNESMRERFADLWLGFEPELFKKWLKGAGFEEIKLEFLDEGKAVFLASAKRAAKKSIFSSNR